MNAWLISLWDRVFGSFWFLPALLVVLAATLGIVLPICDENVRIHTEGLRWLNTTPEGARTVLSVIAGAMITVAGVVFSVTMVTLSIASSQFGSRVLRNRMRDRATQLALGAFLGTSVYCFLVLRTIQETDETTFVPHISVTAGIALAVGSLFVLIYFIHDVVEAVQAPHIVARLAYDLDRSITRLFPEKIGQIGNATEEEDEGLGRPTADSKEWTIESRQEGYLQAIDGQTLLGLARRHDTVVELLVRPGTFVTQGDVIAKVSADAAHTGEFAKAVDECLIVGNVRTPWQDLNSAILELAQLSVRALSPGINDPFTAMNGIDRLSAALGRLAQRKIPSRYRRDENGQLRVVADRVTFDEALAAAFNQIRQHAQSSPPVGVRLLEGLQSIARKTRREADRQALIQQARMVRETFEKADLLAGDLRGIQRAFEGVKAAVDESRSYHSAPENRTTQARTRSNEDAKKETDPPSSQPPAEGDVNG